MCASSSLDAAVGRDCRSDMGNRCSFSEMTKSEIRRDAGCEADEAGLLHPKQCIEGQLRKKSRASSSGSDFVIRFSSFLSRGDDPRLSSGDEQSLTRSEGKRRAGLDNHGRSAGENARRASDPLRGDAGRRGPARERASDDDVGRHERDDRLAAHGTRGERTRGWARPRGSRSPSRRRERWERTWVRNNRSIDKPRRHRSRIEPFGLMSSISWTSHVLVRWHCDPDIATSVGNGWFAHRWS